MKSNQFLGGKNMSKAKKIGILTYHRAYNYGAVLQTYALQSAIQKLDYNVEIIDYRCDYSENIGSEKSIKNIIKFILSGHRINQTKKKFIKFRNDKLNLSNDNFNRDNIEKVADSYEVYIVGSDQVWNYQGSNFDKTYFLDFVKQNMKKKSYAASFGISGIPPKYEKEYIRLLNEFNDISVREKQGVNIINNLLGKDCKLVLDPTLLLSKNEWKEKASITNRIIKEKYLLIYSFGMTDSIYSTAKKIAKERNLKIIMISNSLRYYKNITKFKGCGPLEFLNLFYYADFIITNSFHGTAFSINFKKEFFVETSQGQAVSVNSRIKCFLELLSVEKRDLQYANETIPVNYNKINQKLIELRKESMKYLKMIIEKDAIYEN